MGQPIAVGVASEPGQCRKLSLSKAATKQARERSMQVSACLGVRTWPVADAIALRESLIALAAARLAGEGQQTKMELVYQYLTGPRFRHRIEAVVERFSDMQADLDRERKTMMRLWAKREEQIRGVVESTAGLYGDLQGIAGRSLLEIDGLDLPLLDGPAADAAE
jgi:hypothetical protein